MAREAGGKPGERGILEAKWKCLEKAGQQPSAVEHAAAPPSQRGTGNQQWTWTHGRPW